MNYIHYLLTNSKTFNQTINSPILKAIILRFILFFLIAFVYHILRCLKITLIVTASGSGAEVIPFLKLWLIMPSAIIFTSFYMWLAKNPNRKFLIYNILGLFCSFFMIFMLFLYPNKELLYLNSLADWIGYHLPKQFHNIIPIICHWPEAIFYVMAEMWSIIVLSVLFWGFCNEVTKLEDAKKFYAIIALGANCAGISSGQYMQTISKSFANSWEHSVTIFLSTVIVSCIIIIFVFIKLNNSQQNTANLINNNISYKISFIESIKCIFRYKYIALLAIMVVGYNIVFNLADVLWISQIKHRFVSPQELNNYLAQLDLLVGIFSLITGLFVFGNLINKCGWKITALVPPIVWLITSVFLYSTLMIEKFGYNLNNLILIFGTLQIALGKAVKYCIFDQIKEMSFIPLSIEQQRNSKTIVDGIMSRAGKSGSSIILQGLLISGIGELITITPIIAILIMITLFAWIYATNKMGNLIAKENTL